MFCNNCGTKNPEGTNYCSGCRARLNVPKLATLRATPDTPVKNNVSASEMELFRKKLRLSVENDAKGVLDFVTVQVPHNDFVQFWPMIDGGFYVEFAVGDSLGVLVNNPCRYDKFDELYRQYGYKYGTGNPEDDFYIKEYPAGSEEDMIREIPELIVAIKGNCLSVCIYDESLKGSDDDVPVPIRKRRWLSPEHDKPLVTMLKLLLIGLVGGALFGVVMFVLSEYYW